MKKLLTLATILAACAITHAPAFASETPVESTPETTIETAAETTPAKAPVGEEAGKLSKEENAECSKEASAGKNGKTPTEKEIAAAFGECIKAKWEAQKEETSPAKEEEIKTEEKK